MYSTQYYCIYVLPGPTSAGWWWSTRFQVANLKGGQIIFSFIFYFYVCIGMLGIHNVAANIIIGPGQPKVWSGFSIQLVIDIGTVPCNHLIFIDTFSNSQFACLGICEISNTMYAYILMHLTYTKLLWEQTAYCFCDLTNYIFQLF